MEQKLRKAADALPEAELTPERIFNRVGETQKKPAINRRRAFALAGCVLLIFLVGIGGFACAAEQKEYNEAIGFFDTYGLSAEGLTRGEIKSVYRDITTNSFTYSKTAEVLEKTIVTNFVQGFELIQEDPSPEELEQVWEDVFYNGTYWVSDPKKVGLHYNYGSNYREVDGYIGEVLEHSYIGKFDGETLLWNTNIEEFWITGYSVVSDGVIAYGETDPCLNQSINYGWFAKVDDNGNLLWVRRLEEGYDFVEISAVLENADGSYAVISRGGLEYLCFARYSVKGELQHTQKTQIGNYGIWNAARLGDGYLVQLGSYMEGEYAKFVRLDAMGNLISGYTYTAEDTMYYITDMLEFRDKVYLSAYAVPMPETQGSRAEIDSILSYLFDNNIWEIDEAELTPMVQKNYTAVLLVCDPDGGEAQEFYQVKASLGGQLSVDEAGRLSWAVENITNASFSPMTSAYSIRGTCHICRYTFDASGKLLHSEKTGEITPYYR